MPNVYWGVHSALTDNANPSILMVGDSWFWYPLHNLAAAISEQMTDQTLVVAGFAGAEAAEWSGRYRKDIDFGFKMYASSVQALMLSGGGNDIAGMRDFLRILRPDCSTAKTEDECLLPGEPGIIMSRIIGAYREVILRFRAYNPTAPVLMHNYDDAWPTGKGLFGPADWLRAPMDAAKVPAALRRPLFKKLIRRLYAEQEMLTGDNNLGPLLPLRTEGTLPENAPDQWWANELHPTPRGFNLLAEKVFVPALKKIV
jgi:hypothetical protein